MQVTATNKKLTVIHAHEIERDANQSYFDIQIIFIIEFCCLH